MPSFLKRLHESSVQLWETTQVELQGHYSVEQLQRLDHYRATTSWWRALAVCLLTPVPTIAIVILLDLLRLEPPGSGTLGSPNVWIRQWFTVFFISICTMEQVWQHLPQLALTPWQLFVIALAGTVTAVGVSFSLSNVVGYPLPFTVVVGTPPWFVVLSILIYLFKREQLHEEPGLGKSVFRYLMVLLCQVVMTMIYPSYNFVYSGLSSTQQTGFVLLLPVLKLVTKNWISRALPDSDDAKPEAVVFNVEIFHALFVSLCMGSTTSGRTIAALMVVDVVQAWLSFIDVMGIVRGLLPLMKKLNAARRRAGDAVTENASSNRSLENIMTTANRIIAVEAFQAAAKQHFHPQKTASRQPTDRLFVRTSVGSRFRNTWRSMSRHVATVVPSPSANAILPNQPSNPARTSSLVLKVASPSARPSSPNAVGPTESLAGKALPADLASLSPVERGVLVQHTQKLLYVTEYIVLIEYTEVIMPLIYDTLLFAMYYRPNREYYTFLFGVCTAASLHSTAANVLAYATLEFISLVVMALIVWWKLRFSLLHQLAFVLENRMINIQAKLLLWVLDTMQTSIVQLGPDYSFRFEWLHKRPGEDTSSRFQGYSTACSAETVAASTNR